MTDPESTIMSYCWPGSDVEKAMCDKILPVVATFDSIQGEGIYIGQPSHFIRLAGCNMVPLCTWCDTKYAMGGNPTKRYIGDLVHEAKNSGLQHVVVTGGEPLIHPGAIDLCDILCRQRLFVTLETNATIYDERLRWSLGLLSLSPKFGSSGHEPNLPVISEYCKWTNHFAAIQIKLVISGSLDLARAETLLSILVERRADFHAIHVVLQPNGDGLDAGGLLGSLKNLTEQVLRTPTLSGLTHIQVLPQLHRLLWGTERGI